MSPSAITRLADGSWCGLAALARRRRRSRSSTARGRASSIRSTSSRCTSSSVRPANGRVAHLGRDRVDRAAAAPQRGDLVGVLDHPHRRRAPSRRARTRSPGARAGGRARSAAQVWSPIAARAGRADERAPPARSGRRSRPTARSRTGRAAPSTRGASRRGHDEPRVAVARQHEHREPFERHRLVAGEVRQVGADRQQQHVDAELVHPRPRARRSRRRSAMSSRAPESRAGRRCSSRSSSRGTRRGRRRPWRRPSRAAGRVADEVHQRHRVPARRRDARRPSMSMTARARRAARGSCAASSSNAGEPSACTVPVP